MNRPFGAFVSLLVFMTLAVIALSASSRSTTVGPKSRRSTSSLHTAPAGGTCYVFLIPEPIATHAFAKEPQVLTTDDEPQLPTMADESEGASRLRHATICAASTIANTNTVLPTNDCLSHYDPTYDSTVYGHANHFGAHASIAKQCVSAEEIVSLFEQFHIHQQKAPHSQPSARLRSVFSRLSSAARLAQLWIVQHWQRLTDDWPRSGEPRDRAALGLQWDEYADLMDEAAQDDAEDTVLSLPLVYRPHVRFSGSMRHSAATVFDDWAPVIGESTNRFEL